jgi:hypothetical protein
MTRVYLCMVDVDAQGTLHPFIYASYSSQKLQKSTAKMSTLPTDVHSSHHRVTRTLGLVFGDAKADTLMRLKAAPEQRCSGL